LMQATMYLLIFAPLSVRIYSDVNSTLINKNCRACLTLYD
jgi:hypothetical protein